ncbi:glycosyltransferase family 2 protein [Geodermatophilus sabuli]|uniref:Glycosyltransferase involved in cell wall bisynthesis n=1 Tax=Geodermatophilus sabuli TaxID=1564158 RepID=A0A285EI75_9ACTN|nr:glycosyltransferase family 2 protein [Geodermatophilus sabuli]MBB3086907.1 glycosyltransferase involved in cell wall biosynthesis [Geodermatophilus sabuli]SNX98720.1 Glycosyltransferase involved in cell wall bisynthesis [Geodermatophilus sabuli]
MEIPDEVTHPLVTVAIPTYRRPKMLRGAIESALAQTYTNTEILVSDSEGSDEVAALVECYGDRRLRYRRNERETNGLENALAMYRHARGELVATLHDDDEWEPRFLEVMVEPLRADPSIVLTFADHWVMDAGGAVLPEWTESNTRERGRAGLPEGRYEPFTRLALVHRAVFFVAATVFRNGLIDWDEVPPEVAPPYEVWMTYLACRDGGAAYYVPQRLMRYRLHDETATRSSRLERAHVYTYDRILADPRVSDLREELLRSSAPFRASLGLSLLADGSADEARRHLLRALTHGARLSASVGLALSLLPPRARASSIDRLRAARARRRSLKSSSSRGAA